MNMKVGAMMELDYEGIGIRVRRLRKAKGLTQLVLAALSNQTPSNISHIERGVTKVSLPALVSIANALDVSADQLLCDSLLVSNDVFECEAAQLMSDCSQREQKIITETIRTLKASLRTSR